MVKRNRRSGRTSSPSSSAAGSSSSRSDAATITTTRTTTTTTTIHHRLESMRICSTKHISSNQLQQLHGMYMNDEDLDKQASEFDNNNEQTLRHIAKDWDG